MTEEPKAQAAQADPNAAGKGDPAPASAGQQDPNAKKASDQAAQQAADKAAQEKQAAEEKRLMEAKDESLSDEDKAKKAEIVKAKDEAAKALKDKAPEKYETFSLPEGLAIKPEVLEKFSALAKGYNLSQEKAQNLVNIAADLIKDSERQTAEKWTEIRGKWVKEIKDDPEFGGAKFTETITRAKRCLGKFGSEAIGKFLESTGYGDNPDLIKMLAKIDKAMGEDVIVDGKPAGTGKSAADVMYPEQGKK